MRSGRNRRTDASWFLAFTLCVGALLIPAICNRFPLLFPDSDAYFEVAYSHQWTLDRSGFYGLFLKPFVMPSAGAVGLWVAIAVQAAIVTTIMLAASRRLAPCTPAAASILVILSTALVSSLPWHTSQIMPDAFTGSLVLLAWLTASRNTDAAGSGLLWLALGSLALVHYTHLPLLAISVAATLFVAAVTGLPLRQTGKRAAAAIITVLAVISAHVAANGLMFGRWTVSPVGGWFLFARVHEDGLARDWLAHHCGRDAPVPLCRIAPSLPNDSQALLWSKGSPLRPYFQGQIATPTFWNWTDMLEQAAIGSIREEPLRFVKNSAISTMHQLTTYEVLDDHCPNECQSPSLTGYRPQIAAPLRRSRQLRDAMPKATVRAVTTVAEGLALIGLVPLLIMAIRRRDPGAQAFVATIVIAIVGNAAIAGALSDVQSRYQSRVAWLAVFATLAILLRWFGHARRNDEGAAELNDAAPAQ